MAGARGHTGPAGLGPQSPIPDKVYFKIGEVALLVGVEPHVLRYWEREVASIRPTKSPSNQRRYRRREIETFREIRRLLYDERYTLAGARQRLLAGERGGEMEGVVESSPEPRETPPPREGQLPLGFPARDQEHRLERVRAGLRELIRLAGEEP